MMEFFLVQIMNNIAVELAEQALFTNIESPFATVWKIGHFPSLH